MSKSAECPSEIEFLSLNRSLRSLPVSRVPSMVRTERASFFKTSANEGLKDCCYKYKTLELDSHKLFQRRISNNFVGLAEGLRLP